MHAIKAEQITCCPICQREATAKGKNGFILCSMHSWIKGLKAIEIIQNNK